MSGMHRLTHTAGIGSRRGSAGPGSPQSAISQDAHRAVSRRGSPAGARARVAVRRLGPGGAAHGGVCREPSRQAGGRIRTFGRG